MNMNPPMNEASGLKPCDASRTALDRDGEEIRLVTLTGSRADSSGAVYGSSKQDIVKCHLWHFSFRWENHTTDSATPLNWAQAEPSLSGEKISQDIEFAALSYAWGDPTKTKAIEVDGVRVSVTANLEAALRALRDFTPIRNGCALWIDALCINQRDVQERSEQVGRMRDIYRLARAVVIWTGTEADGSGKAFELLHTMSRSWQDETHEDLASAVRSGTGSIAPGSWAALTAFMQRPYWNRLWILQEIAMGNRSTPIVCGSHVITWGELYDALNDFASRYVDVVFAKVDLESRAAGIQSNGLKRNHLIQLNLQQRDQYVIDEDGTPERLLPILDIGRKCLVSDDKDRVYGVLGMLPGSIRRQIKPNYAKSIEDIYLEFAVAVIDARKDLLLLEECIWSQDRNMPSWVPDWRLSDSNRLFSGRPTYSCARGIAGSPNFSADHKLLRCTGILVDIIDGLGATYFEGVSFKKDHDGISQPRNDKNPYGDESGQRRAVWQMLIGNRTPTGKTAGTELASLLECPLEDLDEARTSVPWRGRAALNSLLEANRHLQVGSRTLGSFFATANSIDSDPPEARLALERMFRMWRTRRPIVTAKGCLGVGPSAARLGDEIWIVAGCDLPLVLRNTPGTGREIVGCCYLQGFMEGEILNTELAARVQTLEIC
ncbi:hypothetical protein AC578_3687 [Pseudocercospora eumusae]|uniref:Heterokaryon incompatibility domain-containing protein n=1 Tax=Pseudocercospora eumusae TaxID=321146 RepID=A0A139HST1_9PEZI|nr:hypothetical protein AC578_3687 [Pseudocercospora eumusae]